MSDDKNEYDDLNTIVKETLQKLQSRRHEQTMPKAKVKLSKADEMTLRHVAELKAELTMHWKLKNFTLCEWVETQFRDDHGIRHPIFEVVFNQDPFKNIPFECIPEQLKPLFEDLRARQQLERAQAKKPSVLRWPWKKP